jgi:serine/threonine protein kinase
MNLSAGNQIGPYTIEKRIAKSGMSSIYLAHETTKPDRRAALKLAHAEDEGDGTFKELIQREAKILGSLRHPGIVRIYPTTIHGRVCYEARAENLPGNPWYFAMEFLDGEPLTEHVKAIGEKFPVDWRLELFYQILTTIEYMHRRGIAHCDLKPENIMFRTKPQPNVLPHPILIDFGTWSDTDNLTSKPAGSALYAPPEVHILLHTAVAEDQLTLIPETFDIWSLGMIFFEIMTGQPMIKAKTLEQARTSVLKRELPTLRSVRPDLPDVMENFLEVMIRNRADQRPHADQLIRALEEKISPPPRISASKK